jgi:hypothetical protein
MAVSEQPMQKLRGSGNTFSTSSKPWLPFRMNPKVGLRNARLRRLMRKGVLQPMTKAQARILCDQAATEFKNR